MNHDPTQSRYAVRVEYTCASEPGSIQLNIPIALSRYKYGPVLFQGPEPGRSRADVIETLRAIREEDRWQDGYASGAVYHGDPDHIEFLNSVYGMQSQSNPLHADLWPSTVRFEAEIVSMTAE